MMTDSAFSSFTNLYSLPKTLRFELVPVGKTRDTMQKNLETDKDGQIKAFLKDQEIEDAYQVLKPVFDKIHEEFITKSLENEKAKEIDFSKYFELKNVSKENLNEKEKEAEEKRLRGEIVKLYEIAGEAFKTEVGNDEKGKPILKEKGAKILTESGIMKHIKSKIDEFANLKLIIREKISWKTNDKNLVEKSDLEKALGTTENKGVFDGFFTYFGGFNQNRENYYSSEEKATAIATRIVNENLPKFVDNIFLFKKQEDEYGKIFNELTEAGKTLKIKDREGNEKEVIQFWNEIFEINYFNTCLSQTQIDDYNLKIGDNNYLINLYNQQEKKRIEEENRKIDEENKGKSKEDKKEHEKFVKLSTFKILFKQIGCGEKKGFIALIKDETELQNVLKTIKEAGDKYFVGKSGNDEEKHKTEEFIELLTNRENYDGIYWNKTAINTISGKYFANWHDLQDKLKDAKVFQKADKNSEEKIKIPDAVELSGLFAILDDDLVENWKEKGILFKDSLFTNGESEIIQNANTPSQALLQMILADLSEFATNFVNDKSVIESGIVKIVDFKNDDEKAKIKLWLDNILAVNRILKYFITKENKRKGNPQDSEVENILDKLIYKFDWFKQYDAVRNYLTKKPQSEINKLKLNFENGSLLGGWSDGQEKLKGAVLLKNGDKFYVGILGKKKNLFDTEKEDNEVYNAINERIGRLILANLKFQTLAGKGFLGEFGKSYGEMGKENPEQVMQSLKKIIRDRYVRKYPLLQQILDKDYSEKKVFDADIQEILKESYVCEFKPIDWEKIESFIENGDLYVFEVKCNQNKIQWEYWQETFKENSVIQLNGGAEIFFRPAGIEKKIKQGYENKNWIIDNKRFAEEKFLFHCPLKLNYKQKDYLAKFNQYLNQKLVQNPENICFLGIDRGEKHLAYYSLVNQKGEIVKDKDGNAIQGSFNNINGQDYNAKLETLSQNRDEARKNWQTIGTIKELKDGYISQVVHEIVKLAIENNAFIVLENLNSGFKNSRKKIEKSVYQKLELALAKKLNFVVDKNAKDGEIKSVQKALQLTPPVQIFSDIEKAQQWGIMLYTRANYTSQTDPKTGWRKTIYLKKGSEESIKSQICEKFDEFGFDGTDYYFKYTHLGKEWTLYSGKDGQGLDRFRGQKDDHDNWQIKKIDIVEILGGVFEKYGKNVAWKFTIDKEGGKITNEQNQEFEPTKKGEHTAWESLRFAIDLIQQIRNSGQKDSEGNPTKDDDFILSPVRGGDGKHFDSREADAIVPNGDANGAYNIARKGAMMFERIKDFEKLTEEEKKKQKYPDLLIRDEEWDGFATGK
ncbi:hypothetical protein AGMMS50249_1290 [candidate division SR1 bacterium]|nr:hypothetical protein AGMMS50249_1290 [candidate division SR1 bacterium]